MTPVAVRGLSAALVGTQRAYSVSLHNYFGAVEKFAGTQIRIADLRIDEITIEMNREFGRRASAGLARAATAAERQTIIDQLVKDVAANASANLPLKNKIAAAAANLEQKDRELEASYQVIAAASAKLDEYIRLKKADETAISELVRTVGLNGEKIISIVGAITKISDDLNQTITGARP